MNTNSYCLAAIASRSENSRAGVRILASKNSRGNVIILELLVLATGT